MSAAMAAAVRKELRQPTEPASHASGAVAASMPKEPPPIWIPVMVENFAGGKRSA